MSNEYILALATLVSIIIGWFLNELSYHFRARGEKEKQLKEVLFNLLEIWYLIKFIDVDFIKAAIEIYISRLNDKFPEIQNNKEVANMLEPLLHQMLQELVPPIVPQNIEKMKERYQCTIDSLSKVDPLMAYRLSNNPEIYNYLSSLDDRLEKMKSVITNLDMTVDKNKLASITTFKSIIAKKMISILEEDISAISAKIDILTWIRTKRKLKTNNNYYKEVSKKIDEILDNLRKAILSGSLKVDTDFGEIARHLKL